MENESLPPDKRKAMWKTLDAASERRRENSVLR